MTVRVDCTPEAAALLEALTATHGPLLFHQSGGCCDGSSPMCFPLGEFRIGANDVYLGRIGATRTPFYIGGAQFEYWRHTALTVTVVPGRGSGFSVEAPEGVRFLIQSRLFTDAEEAELAAAGPPGRGPEAMEPTDG
jgi:uncharacterized protein (DUF779 family)